MEIDHSPHNIIDDLQSFAIGKFCFLFVNLVVQTPIIHELSHKLVMIEFNAQPHVQNNIWMLQITQNLNLFHKILSAFVQPASLHIVFHSDGT